MAVASDLRCEKCSYLLRGLALRGRCPECGHRIRDSLDAVARARAARSRVELAVAVEAHNLARPIAVWATAALALLASARLPVHDPPSSSALAELFSSLGLVPFLGSSLASGCGAALAGRLGFLGFLSYRELFCNGAALAMASAASVALVGRVLPPQAVLATSPMVLTWWLLRPESRDLKIIALLVLLPGVLGALLSLPRSA